MITLDPHPSLDAVLFQTTFPDRLETVDGRAVLAGLFAPDAPAPLRSDDELRRTVRDVLRHGGYKPTGRGKPSSEYLLRAAGDGSLGSVNVAVDVCNAVSLHSGLPVSVVDLDRAAAPFRVGIASKGASYVFNASGQVIDLTGLVCLFDAEGPCANPVKDAQRTKTHGGTVRTLSVVWGVSARHAVTAAAVDWYRALLAAVGASTAVWTGASA